MIVNDALNMIRNALHGDEVDMNINYFGLYDEEGNNIHWVPLTAREKGNTGALHTVWEALDVDGAMEIRTIKFYAGATSTPDSGTLISAVAWTKDKTNLESIQFNRTDTIGRG